MNESATITGVGVAQLGNRPTLPERIARRKAHLEEQLTELNKAEKIIQDNPAIGVLLGILTAANL